LRAELRVYWSDGGRWGWRRAGAPPASSCGASAAGWHSWTT